MKINNISIEIEKKITNIHGLTYIPQITNFGENANNEEGLPFTYGYTVEVSRNNFLLMEELTKKYAKKSIVEIGVNRNGQNSFTWAMLNNKPKDVIYLGIDIEDKSNINDTKSNIYTIQANSYNQEQIRNYMKEIKLNEISILFIDGGHSVSDVINDWKYSDILSENGIVVFHDTNYHPGPVVFLEAIDKKIYKVDKFFTNEPGDCGMSVAYKLEK